jgi:hypothetical protein
VKDATGYTGVDQSWKDIRSPVARVARESDATEETGVDQSCWKPVTQLLVLLVKSATVLTGVDRVLAPVEGPVARVACEAGYC